MKKSVILSERRLSRISVVIAQHGRRLCNTLNLSKQPEYIASLHDVINSYRREKILREFKITFKQLVNEIENSREVRILEELHEEILDVIDGKYDFLEELW